MLLKKIKTITIFIIGQSLAKLCGKSTFGVEGKGKWFFLPKVVRLSIIISEESCLQDFSKDHTIVSKRFYRHYYFICKTRVGISKYVAAKIEEFACPIICFFLVSSKIPSLSPFFICKNENILFMSNFLLAKSCQTCQFSFSRAHLGQKIPQKLFQVCLIR